ncbi:MAG: PEP-CTERM sorting domain-containing protein, partial [Terriglobales bacterium]
DGAIVNGSLDTVYLNGEDFTLGSTHLLGGDTTDFFLNAPISLAPGAQSGPIALFTFNIAAGTPGDEYNNNFLDIIGGTDPSDFTDVLAGSEYAVWVTSTPEAGTLLLLTLGLAFLLGLRRAVPAAR